MVDDAFEKAVKDVILSDKTANIIINWEEENVKQRGDVFEALQSLSYYELGDLLRKMEHFKKGLDGECEYWPLHYANRVATHYYDVKAVDAAQSAASTAEKSLEVATKATCAAKLSAKAADRSAKAADKSAKTGALAFRVSAGALAVTTGTLLWSILSPQKHEFILPSPLQLGTTVQEIKARERQLNDRISRLESRLEALAPSADEKNPDTPSSAGYRSIKTKED